MSNLPEEKTINTKDLKLITEQSGLWVCCENGHDIPFEDLQFTPLCRSNDHPWLFYEAVQKCPKCDSDHFYIYRTKEVEQQNEEKK
ncbi:MAG: hypothetical protein ACOC4M_07395 [Promethearchaeia archaeon]